MIPNKVFTLLKLGAETTHYDDAKYTYDCQQTREKERDKLGSQKHAHPLLSLPLTELFPVNNPTYPMQ
jgi:hypothetical protein